MKLLVIGSGGRECALVWKLAQSPRVTELLVAPGSDGIAEIPKARSVAVKTEDLDGLLVVARREQVALTVVGPEAPLVAGVVNRFREEDLKIFGPTAAAARLEGSKSFAKQFMGRHGIPTAPHREFDDFEAAQRAVEAELPPPHVIKADGLAGGKGVAVSFLAEDTVRTLQKMMIDGAFGAAGRKVVIEQYLQGEEASILSISDGRSLCLLESSQDHKRLADGDTGPNTGGMGAYSPAPVVTAAMSQIILDRILQPTVAGMLGEGQPFSGTLYAGLMITREGPKVLEYNVRFGDPEIQAILPRLRTDLADLLLAAVEGRLDQVRLEWDPRPCVCVVLASAGYPGAPATGQPIEGIEAAAALTDIWVFHAGTRREGGRWVTAGGRVLNVVALGETFQAAIQRAYQAVEKIHFDGMQVRKDIGQRALVGAGEGWRVKGAR